MDNQVNEQLNENVREEKKEQNQYFFWYKKKTTPFRK